MHLFRGLLHFQKADNLQSALDGSSQTSPECLAVCCCSPVALVDPKRIGTRKLLLRKET